MLKDEIEKKSIKQKDSKLRIEINRMRVKIKIKGKLEGSNKFLIWGLNWKE